MFLKIKSTLVRTDLLLKPNNQLWKEDSDPWYLDPRVLGPHAYFLPPTVFLIPEA